MTSAFSSNDVEVLSRGVEVNEAAPLATSLWEMYEISRCAKYIKKNKCLKVALQFPDYMLGDAAKVATQLQDNTDADVYVLADTSYGSYDVDEVAAQHINSDLIIHYGKASVLANTKTPTLYVFGRGNLNVDHVADAFSKCFVDKNKKVILLSAVSYLKSVEELFVKLSTEYINLCTAKLKIPQPPKSTSPSDKIDEDFCTNSCPDCTCAIKNSSKSTQETTDQSVFEFQSFKISLKEGFGVDEYSLFFVGSEKSEMLRNFQLQHPNCQGFVYNPNSLECNTLSTTTNKFLMKRYFITEKMKDSQTVGILVGTMGMAGFREIIKHLKEILKKSGKKTYTFVVGKLNPQKLANFPEIDIFVMVACPDESIVDARDFFKPIATPYEVEVACNANRQWGETYVTNFTELLPGGKHYVEFAPNEESTMSLVSGKLRSTSVEIPETSSDDRQVDTIREKALSVFHPFSSAQFYADRTWQGLEQKLGETPVGGAKEGRSGLPMTYTNEL